MPVPRSQFLQDVSQALVVSIVSPNAFGGDQVQFQNDINTAEQATYVENPTPFEAFNLPNISQINPNFVPSVIPAMENTIITSLDSQRDPIQRAVINDLVQIANQVNNRSDIELLLLEKLNMILQYLQTSVKSTSYAAKVVYLLNELNSKNSLLYTNFAQGTLEAIQGVALNPKLKDKGGFRFFNTNVLDGAQNIISVPRPKFTLFKKSNFRTSESFRDYISIFARVKNTIYQPGQNQFSAPTVVFHFFSNVSNDLLYKVYFTLGSGFDIYNNISSNPTLITWGQDPRQLSFASPRDYDYLVSLNFNNIFRVERYDGQTLEIDNVASSEYVAKSDLINIMNPLILKEVSFEFLAENNKDINPIDTTLFSFGNLVKGGLPQEYVCYQQ